MHVKLGMSLNILKSDSLDSKQQPDVQQPFACGRDIWYGANAMINAPCLLVAKVERAATYIYETRAFIWWSFRKLGFFNFALEILHISCLCIL